MIIRDRELGKDCIQNQKCRILQVNRKEIARIRYVVFSRVICIPKRKQILKHNFELKTKVGFNFFCERLPEQKEYQWLKMYILTCVLMVWTLNRADAAVQEKNVKQKIQSLIQNYNNLEQGNFFKRCKLDLSR